MPFYISAEKSSNLRTNLIFWHSIYISWIRIRICISPYGSGSGSKFYYKNPDPHYCLQHFFFAEGFCILLYRKLMKEIFDLKMKKAAKAEITEKKIQVTAVLSTVFTRFQ